MRVVSWPSSIRPRPTSTTWLCWSPVNRRQCSLARLPESRHDEHRRCRNVDGPFRNITIGDRGLGQVEQILAVAPGEVDAALALDQPKVVVPVRAMDGVAAVEVVLDKRHIG